MKNLFLLIAFLTSAQLAHALSVEDEESYKTQYSKEYTPVVIKKLSSDRPDMSAKAIKSEAEAYVLKMASCQLEGLSHFPEKYREKAIMPVVAGQSVNATTQALNALLKQDVEAGKISKDELSTMIQFAQESVQICLNS